MKRWSKLQKAVESRFAPGLDLHIQCRVYRMDSRSGSTGLPRYWATLDGVVIWDYPQDFPRLAADYPYVTDIRAISGLLRDYLDTPVAALMHRPFRDPWCLIDILLAADRRIGHRRLGSLKARVQHPGALAVLTARWATDRAGSSAVE
jgi:hypothetical protein